MLDTASRSVDGWEGRTQGTTIGHSGHSHNMMGVCWSVSAQMSGNREKRFNVLDTNRLFPMKMSTLCHTATCPVAVLLSLQSKTSQTLVCMNSDVFTVITVSSEWV